MQKTKCQALGGNLSAHQGKIRARESWNNPALFSKSTANSSRNINLLPRQLENSGNVLSRCGKIEFHLTIFLGQHYDFEALTTLKDTYGSNIGALVGFIEQRHEVPPKFRRLVTQGKLGKAQNCYKFKNETAMAIKTPSPKKRTLGHDRRIVLASGLIGSGETAGEAAKAAAYMVADAENRSFVADEAVKEAERISKMACYS